MSRVGSLPIILPDGVTLQVSDNNVVLVKGPKGELSQNVNPDINIKLEENKVILTRLSEQKEHKAMHGLYRSLIKNMVEGVSKGFQIQLELRSRKELAR